MPYNNFKTEFIIRFFNYIQIVTNILYFQSRMRLKIKINLSKYVLCICNFVYVLCHRNCLIRSEYIKLSQKE